METIIKARWLSSMESGYPVNIGGEAAVSPEAVEYLPFRLGKRFGYVDRSGRFTVNRILAEYLSISNKYWAEYTGIPGAIDILDPLGETAFTIGNGRGYPFFLDDRIFLIAEEQNSLSALDDTGKVLWTYDFAAPITCIDAAAGLILTGSLDGAVEILDNSGKRLFFFEPGGSRLSVILGCSLSRDGSRLGIISGIDDQRFLLLERFGAQENGEYKVVYHEFLDDGFRRAVNISFIDNDNRIAFERSGGLGIYELNARQSRKILLDGDIAAMETKGNDGLLFVVTSQSSVQKQLVAIRLPETIVMQAPFKSGAAFLEREGSRLYVGGGSTLASFELDKK
jgi:hypothetical protein